MKRNLVLSLLLGGCFEPNPGVDCWEEETRIVDDLDASAPELQAKPRAGLDMAADPRVATLSWLSPEDASPIGETTNLTISVSSRPGTTEASDACGSVRTPVRVTMISDDGTLDEGFVGDYEISSSSMTTPVRLAATAWIDLPADHVYEGTFDPSSDVVGTLEAVSVVAHFREDSCEGELVVVEGRGSSVNAHPVARWACE